jgi:hypothetical protein
LGSLKKKLRVAPPLEIVAEQEAVHAREAKTFARFNAASRLFLPSISNEHRSR